jgi:hypothetical protein
MYSRSKSTCAQVLSLFKAHRLCVSLNFKIESDKEDDRASIPPCRVAGGESI